MIQSKRETISNELLRRLNYLASCRDPDHTAIGHIEFSAQKLKSVNYSSYLMVLAVCECLKGNSHEMHTYFEQALAETPNFAVYDNYAISLQYLAEIDDLLKLFGRMAREDGDVAIQRIARNWFQDYGCISEAAAVEEVLIRMGQESTMIDYPEVLESLNRRGLVEADLTNVIKAARLFLNASGYKQVMNSRHYRVSDSEPVLVQRFNVIAESVEAVFESELAMTQHLLSLDLPGYEKNAICVMLAADTSEAETCNDNAAS